MLRSLLRYGAPVIAGQALKRRVKSHARRLAGYSVAALFFLVAAVFALIALHAWLIDLQFSNLSAAAIIAAGCAGAGLLVLVAGAVARSRTKGTMTTGEHSGFMQTGQGSTVGELDKQMGTLVDQIGPMKLLAIAFSIGMAASRSGKDK